MTRSHSEHRYRRIGWGAASGLGARFAAILFGMWTVPLLVAYLGKTDYGVLLVGQSVVAWFALLDMGIAGSLTNHLAEAAGRDDHARTRTLVLAALLVYLAAGLLGFLACLLIPALPVREWFPQATAREAGLILRTVQYSGMMFCLVLPLQLMHSILRARQLSHYANAIMVAGSLIGFVSVWAGIRLQMSLAVIATLQAASFAIPTLPLWVAAARRHLAARAGCGWPAGTVFRSLFRLSVPMFMFQLGGLVINESARFLISRRCGFETRRTTAWPCASTGWSFWAGSEPQPFYLALREARARGHHAWVRHALLRLFLVRLSVIGLAGILLLVWGDAILELWSGQPLKHPPGPAGWACLVTLMLAASFTSTVSEVMSAMDRVWSQLPVLIGNAAILFLCLHLTLPAWGATGAFFAMLAGTMVSLAWSVDRLVRDPLFRKRDVTRNAGALEN
ncbi:MAG: hypothetical protein U1F77_01495 [Kiritimatiellia bacterium]